MLKNYLAIDLRGIKDELFEHVVSLDDENADFKGIMLKPEQLGRAKDIISNERPDLVFCMGGSLSNNRKIIDNPYIDILTRPYPIDDTLAKLANRNGKAFEICVREIIESRGYTRSRTIQSLNRTVSLARKRKVDVVITSGATEPMERMTPRELVAFGSVLGMDYPEAKGAISTVPRSLLEGRDLL